MKPVTGLTLGGRYRLERQIAVGGMGEVWVAHDTSLARDVAVKVLKEEYAGNEDFLDRLRTEARNSAGLSHTNIAQLYDYGEQAGSGYLVMELIMGEPMNDLLEREPVLSPRRLLPILAQTARGLHAAHVGGVVHRDIKPGNILLEHGSVVKITDFGVSLAANQVPMTAAGMVMGTAQYLSPEQAIGKAATGASDIYALGIVAYESLVGHRPFTGPTAVDIAVAHVNEEVPPLPRTVHPDLAELVMQMLAKDPTKRPRSGASLASMLDELAVSLEEDPYGRRPVGRRGISTSTPASPPSAPIDPEAVRQSRPRPSSSPHTAGGPSAPRVAGRTARDAWPSIRSAPKPLKIPPPPETRASRAAQPRRPVPYPSGDHQAPRSSRPGDIPGARRTSRNTGVHRPVPRPEDAARAGGENKYVARRAAQPTGVRMGKLSWPLLGLLALLALLLLAALVNGLTGGGNSDAQGTVPGSHVATNRADPRMDLARGGMISAVAPRVGSIGAIPTKTKDE